VTGDRLIKFSEDTEVRLEALACKTKVPNIETVLNDAFRTHESIVDRLAQGFVFWAQGKDGELHEVQFLRQPDDKTDPGNYLRLVTDDE